MSTGLAVAGLIFSAYQFTEQRQAQAQARREAEEAREAQQRAALAQNRRERQQAIERARRRRAAVLAQTQARGALQSSPVQGALGSLQAQTTSNVSFQRQLQRLSQFQQEALESSAQAQGRAQTASALGQLPTQFGFNNARTFSNVIDFFNQPTGTSGNSFQGVAASTPRTQ